MTFPPIDFLTTRGWLWLRHWHSNTFFITSDLCARTHSQTRRDTLSSTCVKHSQCLWNTAKSMTIKIVHLLNNAPHATCNTWAHTHTHTHKPCNMIRISFEFERSQCFVRTLCVFARNWVVCTAHIIISNGTRCAALIFQFTLWVFMSAPIHSLVIHNHNSWKHDKKHDAAAAAAPAERRPLCVRVRLCVVRLFVCIDFYLWPGLYRTRFYLVYGRGLCIDCGSNANHSSYQTT